MTDSRICFMCDGYGVVVDKAEEVITEEMAKQSGHPEYAGMKAAAERTVTCPECGGTGLLLAKE